MRDRRLAEAEAAFRADALGSVADAEVERAEAEVACIRAAIAERTLRAPFSGVITAAFGDPGLEALRAALAVPVTGIAEAGMLATLRHRNIAGLIGLVEDGGQCCLVREFVAGESLAERLRRCGALPWREASGLVVQALRGLGEAHKAHVIHRDITPANLLIAADGTLKLAGFGIAGILDKAGLTRTGSGVDALHYVSPEQVRGALVDERSDLYLMAVVLYQARTCGFQCVGPTSPPCGTASTPRSAYGTRRGACSRRPSASRQRPP